MNNIETEKITEEFDKLLKILNTKIMERCFMTPVGSESNRPNKGKNTLTDIWVKPVDLSILTKHGYKLGYNNGYIHEGAQCYFRRTKFKYVWGYLIKVYVKPSNFNGLIHICLDYDSKIEQRY